VLSSHHAAMNSRSDMLSARSGVKSQPVENAVAHLPGEQCGLHGSPRRKSWFNARSGAAMSSKDLVLRCRTCNSADRSSVQSPPWVAFEASRAEWLDPEAALPTSDEWERSSIIPLADSERHIRVSHPFAAASGALFWVMFATGPVAFDGWAEHPEAIAASAFAHCRLVDIARRAESWAWIRVAIDDVVPVPELERRFPPRVGSLPPRVRHIRVVRTSSQDWELIEGSSEGDVGAWFLVRHSRQKVHLLIEGYWSFHEDTVWAGNMEVTEEQWVSFRDGMELR
jgi:hypothetical protein